jgi:hypothetical protein
MEFEWIAKIPTVPDATEDFTVRAGLLDATAANLAAVVDGVYFEVIRATSTTNWICKTVSNSTTTTTTTGTAFGTGWVRLKAVVNAGGTSVEFFINGTSVATHSANIPTGAGRLTSPQIRIDKVAGTTERTLLFDYFEMNQSFTTLR